jgi:hypothetical protein
MRYAALLNLSLPATFYRETAAKSPFELFQSLAAFQLVWRELPEAGVMRLFL